MSSLTGNQIKNTYQGLLKLADSSTGITNSFQAIEDGLGNNTGLRISINQFEAPNIAGFHQLKGAYYGLPLAINAPQQMANGTQNIILATPFYDNGLYAYSGANYNVISATSTSDTVEFAIYTSQMIGVDGLYPYEPIISGLTAETSSTGLKTITFPTTLSMSGYGGGIYWVVWKISNSGVQPTIRFGGNLATQGNLVFQAAAIYGSAAGFNGIPQQYSPFRANGNYQSLTGQTTFDNPFGNDLNSKQSTAPIVNGSTLALALLPI